MEILKTKQKYRSASQVITVTLTPAQKLQIKNHVYCFMADQILPNDVYSIHFYDDEIMDQTQTTFSIETEDIRQASFWLTESEYLDNVISEFLNN